MKFTILYCVVCEFCTKFVLLLVNKTNSHAAQISLSKKPPMHLDQRPMHGAKMVKEELGKLRKRVCFRLSSKAHKRLSKSGGQRQTLRKTLLEKQKVLKDIQ